MLKLQSLNSATWCRSLLLKLQPAQHGQQLVEQSGHLTHVYLDHPMRLPEAAQMHNTVQLTKFKVD
jgi:hypothetical protein